MRTIDADALSAFVGDLRSTLHKEQTTFKAMTELEFNTRDYMLLNFQQTIDNAPTVEPYKGEECVNIKMSDEEIKQFKQVLQEHTPLYTITSDTFVEGASAERPHGEWIIDGHHYKCSRCGKTLAIMFSETDDGDLIGCPFCLADMRGGRGTRKTELS